MEKGEMTMDARTEMTESEMDSEDTEKSLASPQWDDESFHVTTKPYTGKGPLHDFVVHKGPF